MYYFEHYLREGGLTAPCVVVILRNPGGDDGLCRDLAAEIEDALPGASVRLVAPGEPPPRCDLLVSVFERPYRFPLHDVLHDSLDQLEGLLRHRAACRSLLLYRARWREAEVVASADLPRLVRRRRSEARLVRLLERSTILGRLLRPLYPGP